jgi:hypothetical protein
MHAFRSGDQVRMQSHGKESMKTARMNNHKIEMHAFRSLRAAHLVFLNHLSICKWIRHRLETLLRKLLILLYFKYAMSMIFYKKQKQESDQLYYFYDINVMSGIIFSLSVVYAPVSVKG